jgi:hypothetical protein
VQLLGDYQILSVVDEQSDLYDSDTVQLQTIDASNGRVMGVMRRGDYVGLANMLEVRSLTVTHPSTIPLSPTGFLSQRSQASLASPAIYKYAKKIYCACTTNENDSDVSYCKY